MVKKNLFNSERKLYMLSIVLIFALSLFSYTDSTAQALACNDNVQVSLNYDCEADITPGMILEGEDEDDLDNYTVSIEGVTGSIVTSPGYYTVTVTDNTSNNSCWGHITVEDKLPPLINSCDCPPGNDLPECQFLCTDLDGILNGTISVPQPDVTENCSSLISNFSDIVTDGGCGEKIITRSWLFSDDSGNETEGCIQEFRTVPVALSDVLAPVSPVLVSCGADVSMPAIVAHFTPLVGADVAATYGYPTVNGVAINGEVCNLLASKVDVELPTCDQSCSNSYKYIREWTVIDWCSSDAINFTQIIKAVDTEEPTIQANDITVSTAPWECVANFYLQAPAILHDDCTDFVEYTVSGPAGVTVTWNAQYNLYYVTGAPKGIHTFVYTASDCCGNTANDPILVTVLDQTAPVAVAKQNIVVSLTNGANGEGVAKIFAESVDNGSHDGCTDVKLEIRRDNDECSVTGNTTYNNDGHPFDANNDPDQGKFVKFCCEDLTNAEVDVDGDGINDEGYVKVWLRVWDDADMNGIYGSDDDNYNETWAFVKVEDKLNPSLQCPPDVTIECDDDATDLSVTGTATGSYTCTNADVEYNDITSNIDNCGVGTIRRRWSIVGSPAVFCDQIIVKSEGNLFNGNINWPNDYTTDCTDLDGDDQVPTWNAPGCSQVGYSLESDTFQFEDGACFKIINQWTVLDWCQYDPNGSTNSGIWEHTQIIKVEDDVAPIMICANQMYEVNDNTDADNDGNKCEVRSLMLTNTADDNGDCASEWLKWTVLVDLWGDGTYDYEFSSNLPTNDNSFNDTNGNNIPDRYLAPTSSGEEVKVTLPEDIQGSMNNHKVRWTVSDGCQNVTSCENTFMVVDKKAPTPYCIDISTALMENGMVELWACDFDLGSFDNCTAEGELRFTFTSTAPQNDSNYNPSTGCSSRIFDCDDLANSPVMVTMYVWDEKDNFDFCEVELTLVDNQGGCDGGNGMRVSGSVSTPTTQMLGDVEVKLTAPSAEIVKFDMTNETGGYSFGNNPDEIMYSIQAKKSGNYLDGVSTLDLVKIQRHLLGLEELDDVYKVIAADINNDEKLTASDLLQLRKLILGVITELPNIDSYLTIDGGQTFADQNNPWPVDQDIVINLEHDMDDQNFLAIKVGDVTDNATYGLLSTEEVTTRSNKTLSLVVDNQTLLANELNKTDVMISENASLVGLQLAINIDVEVSNLTSDILNLDKSNYNVSEGILYISWSSASKVELAKGDVLFTIESRSNTNNTVSNAIEINTESTIAPEAYNTNLDVLNLDIVTRNTIVSEVFEVYQNEPNPFGEVTVIGYNLSEAGKVNLTVTDITGRVVYTKQNSSTKGQGQFTIQANNLKQSGVYYYTVKAGEKTVTNKMILIK